MLSYMRALDIIKIFKQLPKSQSISRLRGIIVCLFNNMDTKYTALLLAFLVAAAEANTINFKSQPTSKLLEAR